MLQVMPRLFLGHFNFQQDEAKLEQIGITHVINLVESTKNTNDVSRIYLEKLTHNGAVLDILILKLEKEMKKKSDIRLLEVPKTAGKDHISKVNDMMLEAMTNFDAAL